MTPETVAFGHFRVDLQNHTLRDDAHELRVTPKAFAVLEYLLARPGQVATKEELLRSVWPSTIVSDAALTVCIRELRRVLGDSARAPRYIETVHRRGFPFIGPVPSPRSKVPSPTFAIAPNLVGRASELEQLHGWLE
ncbi:MAG: transcriptional regulator, partial [Deltaproteobacteria bacterium]|nr:transcriptional regulator [Deltaproteobacteria bacterium]